MSNFLRVTGLEGVDPAFSPLDRADHPAAVWCGVGRGRSSAGGVGDSRIQASLERVEVAAVEEGGPGSAGAVD